MTNKYKVKVFGDGSWYSLQIPRIIQGFRELGHTVVSDRAPVEGFEPDFIYCNDPGYYDKAIEYRNKYGGRLIFNVLDIPKHDNNWQDVVQNLKNKLPAADIITSISKTTQKDLLQDTGINSEVIYNPAKEMIRLNEEKVYSFYSGGRLNSKNKRMSLVIGAVMKLNLPLSSLTSFIFTGSEGYPFKGATYAGVVNDIELNYIHNVSKIYLHPSKFEGLGLGSIQSLIVDTPVVACNDCDASVEFLPEEMLTNPNKEDYSAKMIEVLENYPKYQKIAQSFGEKYKKQFNKVAVAENIIREFEKTT